MTAIRPRRGARTPPHDLDAEESLLGSCLLTIDAVRASIDAHVGPADFYKPTNTTIYRAILDLYADDQPIDPTTVAAHLRRAGNIDQIGGRAELQRIQASAPASVNAGAYARTVRGTAEDRKLLRLASDLTEAVYNAAPTLPIIEAIQHPSTTEPHGWGPVDLADILHGDLTAPEPELLCRDDGRHLLYRGRIHAINGESESLKSWLALHGTAQEIRLGHDVLYLDFEDTAESICSRLLGLGLHPSDILAGLIYVRPDQPLDLAAGQTLERLITTRQPTLAVVDGVTEAMSLEGLDLLDNSDVATWLTRLPRRMKSLGPAVVLIDHVAKHAENRRRGGIGGQHKLAGIDVSYLVEAILPLAHVAAGNTEPITGTSRITVEKDRPGGIRAFAANRKYVGELQLTAYPDGGITGHIVPAVELPEGGFRPTAIMERISRVLERAAMPLTKKAVRAAVKGKSETKDLALELLVGEEFVTVALGPNRMQLHSSARAYRAKEDHQTADIEEDDEDDDGLF